MEPLSRHAIKSLMQEVEAREVLRRWLDTSNEECDMRITAGTDSATVRRYVQAGEAAGSRPNRLPSRCAKVPRPQLAQVAVVPRGHPGGCAGTR
jgi:hypothetical protein